MPRAPCASACVDFKERQILAGLPRGPARVRLTCGARGNCFSAIEHNDKTRAQAVGDLSVALPPALPPCPSPSRASPLSVESQTTAHSLTTPPLYPCLALPQNRPPPPLPQPHLCVESQMTAHSCVRSAAGDALGAKQLPGPVIPLAAFTAARPSCRACCSRVSEAAAAAPAAGAAPAPAAGAAAEDAARCWRSAPASASLSCVMSPTCKEGAHGAGGGGGGARAHIQCTSTSPIPHMHSSHVTRHTMSLACQALHVSHACQILWHVTATEL